MRKLIKRNRASNSLTWVSRPRATNGTKSSRRWIWKRSSKRPSKRIMSAKGRNIWRNLSDATKITPKRLTFMTRQTARSLSALTRCSTKQASHTKKPNWLNNQTTAPNPPRAQMTKALKRNKSFLWMTEQTRRMQLPKKTRRLWHEMTICKKLGTISNKLNSWLTTSYQRVMTSSIGLINFSFLAT